jgi:ParB-like nuclease domain
MIIMAAPKQLQPDYTAYEDVKPFVYSKTAGCSEGDIDADGNTINMVTSKEIGFLPSRDYPGKIGDIKYMPGGDHDKAVKSIKADAKLNGIQVPIRVVGAGGGSRFLADGHHRYVAGKELRIPIPVVGLYEELKGGMTK